MGEGEKGGGCRRGSQKDKCDLFSFFRPLFFFLMHMFLGTKENNV